MDNFNHPTAGISGLLTKGDQGVFPPNPSSLEPVELLGISFPLDWLIVRLRYIILFFNISDRQTYRPKSNHLSCETDDLTTCYV